MKDLLEIYHKTKYLYEKLYDIHICETTEIYDVIEFIDKYWQKGHILTKSRELLDWQHYDKKHDRYNFVVARSRKNGEIHGIIGFILSSIYDFEIKNPIRWGVIWKIRDDVATKGLGVVLKGFMEENVPTDFIGGVGLSIYSKTIDAKLGEKMGQLSQYYIANPDMREFNLVSNPEFTSISKLRKSDNKRFVEIPEEEFLYKSRDLDKYIMPYKSVRYYINRYYRHPIYNYNFVGITDGLGVLEAIFIYRKCETNIGNNIFIVDFFGNPNVLEGGYEQFIELLRKENAECISFPCSGIDECCLRNAGFCLRNDSKMILPVYYEPFEKCNVDLDYHFWTKNQFVGEIIVKGDADQDRPNRLPEDDK